MDKTNHEMHIMLWDQLAQTGSSKKSATFTELFPDLDYSGEFSKASVMDCFACQEAEPVGCKACPIEWTEDAKNPDIPCCKKGSPYRNWGTASTTAEHKHWAAVICDMPWTSKKEE